MKECSTCLRALSLECFSINHGKPRATCKECRRAGERARYWQNPDKSRAYSRRYRAEHPEQVREALREWGTKNAEHKRAYMADYYADHKTDWRTGEHARRAGKLGAVGTHSTRDWQRLLARHKGKCAYCGSPATQRDHVIPLTRGGTNFIGNILPACSTCNPAKGTQFISEWALARRAN